MLALLVDLNNFARYPTLAVGYLVAALRKAAIEVELLSPLASGLPATSRERRETARDQILRRVYFSTHPLVVPAHDLMWSAWSRRTGRLHPQALESAQRAIRERPPDVLLLSAYVDHYDAVTKLAEMAQQSGIPVLLGGPVFNIRSIAEEWRSIPGLTAVVGAEVDLNLAELVEAVVVGDDLTQFEGVLLPDGRSGPPSRPLRQLDQLPIPDFRDFPWSRYPTPIIPVMTGRGCSWAACTFCADVQTANGRTFRSRPVDSVLDELQHQAERHKTKNFIFLDIKLNSDLGMWHGLIEQFQKRVPDARWIGVVHVQADGDSGLSREELEAAYAAGLIRVTFGLESGSQSLTNVMAKGTRVERTSEFVRDAYAAGISVRSTAFVGYPRETAADLDATHTFLKAHQREFDRIRLGLFKAIPGTRFAELYDRRPSRFDGLTHFRWDDRYARASYRYQPSLDRSYRRAKTRVLRLVHEINRRPLRPGAEAFDGLM